MVFFCLCLIALAAGVVLLLTWKQAVNTILFVCHFNGCNRPTLHILANRLLWTQIIFESDARQLFHKAFTVDDYVRCNGLVSIGTSLIYRYLKKIPNRISGLHFIVLPVHWNAFMESLWKEPVFKCPSNTKKKDYNRAAKIDREISN